MMKSYPIYKNSGIEWICKIPKGWGVSRLKYIDKCVMGQSPESEKCNKDGVGIPFLQGNADFMTFNPVPSVWCEEANKLAEPDDVLLSVRAPVGAVNIADQVYGIGRGLCAIRARQSHKRYLYFKALCLLEELNSIATGSTYTAVSVEQVNNVFLPHPSYDEQGAISDYLDHKTTQIDELIAKKERMIELLKEERTAIINQAVTKGLGPKVEMKDSGVEWLGRVPKHWEVKRLKYLVQGKLEYGANEVGELDDIKMPRYIRITDFDDDGNLRRDTFKSLPESKAKEYLLQEGDVLFARSGAPVGKTFQFKNYKGRACFAGYLIRARPNQKILSDFLYYFTRSNAYENWKNSIFNQATIQNIGADKYSILTLPLPSAKEQKEIVNLIIAKCGSIDGIIFRAEQSVEFLKEYRTALISEAVTGKIDVSTALNTGVRG